MYKIVGFILFVVFILWIIWSNNIKLHEEIVSLKNTNASLVKEVDIGNACLNREQELITHISDTNLIYKKEIELLKNDLNISLNKKPVVRWRTKYITNPKYVKCIK